MVSDLVPFLVSMRFISTDYCWNYIHTYILSLFFLYVKKVTNYKFVRQDDLLGSCVQLLVRGVYNILICGVKIEYSVLLLCTYIRHMNTIYH